VNIPDPDGTRQPCRDCKEPTVIAVTATGSERVHCGTRDHRCYTQPRRTTR
jgi:hypothetical protein